MHTQMKNVFLFIALLSIAFTLSGCFEARELEDLTYVIALGIDKGQSKKYAFTFQLAVPIKIAGEGGGTGSGKGSTSTITIDADTLYNAISRANTLVSKEMTLSHNKIIIFSEQVAKNGIGDLLNSFITNREIRPQTDILVLKGETKDLLSNIEPVLETNPARNYELLLDSSEYTGYAISNNLLHFYLASHDEFSSPYAVIIETAQKNQSSGSIRQSTSQNASKQTGGDKQDSNEDNKQSGDNQQSNNESSKPSGDNKQSNSGNNKQSDTNQQNKSEEDKQEDTKDQTQSTDITGIAVFRNDQFVGEISDDLIISHLILKGNLRKVNIDIEDIKDPNKKSVMKLIQKESPSIQVKIEQNIPKIFINVKLSCQLITSASNVDYVQKENRQKLNENIVKKLKQDTMQYLNKIAKEYQADPIGFGKYYRTNVLTLAELEQVDWQKIFPSSEFHLDFQLHLDTTQMLSNEVEKGQVSRG